ncbi:MAG TPA: hypothetical protein VF663_05470 [Telluria sp.]
MLALIAMSASGAGVTSASDACFKQVFQKRAGESTWLVRECQDGATLRYRIAYRATQAGAAAAADITMHKIDDIVGVEYRTVGPATLLLDAPAERGGRAYLLHPVDGRPALSVAAFHYMSGDEESLTARQKGQRIRASTRQDAHVFDIAPNGALTRAVTTEKQRTSVSGPATGHH